MSTVKAPLKYLWTGYFDDGKVLEQPEDDRYSKHDDAADHNPTAFRDLLDYCSKANLIYFDINDGTFAYGVDLPTGNFGINGTWFNIEDQDEPLSDRKIVFWREVLKKTHISREKTGEQNEKGEDLYRDVIVEDEPYVNAYYFGYKGKNAKGKEVVKTIRVM